MTKADLMKKLDNMLSQAERDRLENDSEKRTRCEA